MLYVIAIADDDFLVGHIEPDADVDILISLGDLYDVTLQEAIDLYAPEHVIAIRGNHCVDAAFPLPTIDLHLKTIERFGLTFGGFAGSWQYKKAGNHMHTQDEAHQLLKDFPVVIRGLYGVLIFKCYSLRTMLLQAKVLRYLLAQFISKSFINSLPC